MLAGCGNFNTTRKLRTAFQDGGSGLPAACAAPQQAL